jgi:hypothetical protein
VADVPQLTCAAEDCDKKIYSRGFCEPHYRKHRKEAGRVKAVNPPVCSIDGCTAKPVARALCSQHYGRLRNRGDATLPALRVRGRVPCAVDGCDQRATNRGHCPAHHRRVLRSGAPGAPLDRTSERFCGYCEEPFASTNMAQKYCGEECARTAKSLGNARWKYGITMQEYRRLWLKQKGVCAICELPERTERNHLLTIDHDHVTDHVRGLLCSQCNRAIGMLQDDPKVIEAAAAYVRRHRQIPLFT